MRRAFVLPPVVVSALTLVLVAEAGLASAAPTFRISQTSGNVGTTVSDSGSGFGKRAAYQVTFGSKTVQQGTTKRGGRFSGSFVVPSGYSGTTTVTAKTSVGSASASFDVTSPPPSTDTTPPSAPSNLAATASDAKVDLSWGASSDDVGVTGYRIIRNGSQIASVSGRTYSDTGVINGTSYSYVVRAIDAAGNVSQDSNTVTARPLAPPPGSTPTLTPVDGGANYYAKFSSPLPTDPSYFPIGVWGAYNMTRANLDLDAAAGLNVYVWPGNQVDMPAIKADGRFRVINDSASSAGPETAGWKLGDEDDASDTATCPNTLNQEKSHYPNDGRMWYANWTKGLALPPGGNAYAANWWADAAEQNCWTNGVDLDSVDFYWFTDPWQGGPYYGFLYGDDIRNLRHADASDGQMHPHWGFVETGWPFPNGSRAIQPAELRSAAWHQIIAGARGIIWFVHSFGGPHTGDQNTLRTNSEGTRPMVTSVDAQIKSLAPALNGPSVDSWSTTGDVETSVKWANGHFYVMAGAKTGATSMTFSMPCVGDASAVVDGESRSVAVSNGSFTDSFADKTTIHIYRIDGGSTCGL
jgi:hypothetical protein